MKREFLEELLVGVEDSKGIIDKIMQQNGADIEKVKSDSEKMKNEMEQVKEKLEIAETSLKEFEGVKPDELNAKITELTKALSDKDTEYAEKLSNMQFTSAIENAITEIGGRNVTAVKALMDLDTLKESSNQNEDIKAALETLKTENDYLFESKEPINNPTGKTTTGGGSDEVHDSALRAALGLTKE